MSIRTKVFLGLMFCPAAACIIALVVNMRVRETIPAVVQHPQPVESPCEVGAVAPAGTSEANGASPKDVSGVVPGEYECATIIGAVQPVLRQGEDGKVKAKASPGAERADQEWPGNLLARAQTDPSGTFAYCMNLPANDPRKEWAVVTVLTGWAGVDSAAALKAVKKLSDREWRERCISLVLSLDVNREPGRTLKNLAADGDLSPGTRSNVAMHAVSALRRKDPAAAVEIIPEIESLDPALRNRLRAEALGDWIASNGTAALVWIKDADVDEDTYDIAIISAINKLCIDRETDAGALLAEFTAAGRMDRIADPFTYSQAVKTAKIVGAVWGARDYQTALASVEDFPAGSATEAYVLSNVAFSQSHGSKLPNMHWIQELPAGFTRTRVVTAVAYGRLLANGNEELHPKVKAQLDCDELDPSTLKELVIMSRLPSGEKETILQWL